MDFLVRGRKRDGDLPRIGGLCASPLSAVKPREIRALFFEVQSETLRHGQEKLEVEAGHHRQTHHGHIL